MQNFLNGTGGNKGKAEVEGDNLVVQSLEEMARAAAATGDDAAAVMTFEPKAPKVRKRLRGNPVVFSQPDVAEDGQKRSVLAQMRDLYNRIRG